LTSLSNSVKILIVLAIRGPSYYPSPHPIPSPHLLSSPSCPALPASLEICRVTLAGCRRTPLKIWTWTEKSCLLFCYYLLLTACQRELVFLHVCEKMVRPVTGELLSLLINSVPTPAREQTPIAHFIHRVFPQMNSAPRTPVPSP
jgi:hypothetical protein